MPPRNHRKVRKTLLLVGEGHAEKAFLNYLKSLYSIRDINVDVVNARGKGPDHILNHSLKCQKYSPRDLVGVLLDTDLAWPEKLVKEANNKGFQLMGAIPCIDGLILEILKEKKPESSKLCKEKLAEILPGPNTDKDTYEKVFNKEILDQAKTGNEILNDLINIMQGIIKPES